MTGETFQVPDSPEIRAWIEAEQAAIEQMYRLAESLRETFPDKAMVMFNGARERAGELLLVLERLDLL
jgi:hypothetical protein